MKSVTLPAAVPGLGPARGFPEDRRHRALLRDAAPALCPCCHAVFQHGHWAWTSAPAGAAEVLCAACERIRKRMPAGYLALDGALTRREHEQLVRLLREAERRESARHVLDRIMDIRHRPGQLQVTTTGVRLAQSLAVAVQRRFGGRCAYCFDPDQHVLRVRWDRSRAHTPC
jgi:hypothetical protein